MTERSQAKLHNNKPSVLADAGLDGFVVALGAQITPELRDLALTHRSWAYEHGGTPHNERLEFLGDSVLGYVVTGYLYRTFPDLSEGDLAKRRASVVSTRALARLARSIELGALIRLGKGESLSGGADKDSILADTVEAVIGAVSLSSEIAETSTFVLQLMEPLLQNIEALSLTLDPKTTLQEAAAQHGLPHPQYDIRQEGPDHDRRYFARVEVVGVEGVGEGTSKKAAELAAAEDAVLRLSATGKLRRA